MNPPMSSCRVLARLASWRDRRTAAARLRILAVTAALSALSCAACAGTGPPHPIKSATSPTSSPSSCLRQYAAWRSGPASQANRRLNTQLRAVSRAARAPAFGALKSVLEPLMPTALALAAQPMPRCADTRGIYANLVLSLYESASKARSAKRLSSLLRAAARLASARKAERQLTAEVIRVLGSAHCPIRDTNTGWPPC